MPNVSTVAGRASSLARTLLLRLHDSPTLRASRDYLLFAQGVALHAPYRRGAIHPRTVVFESYQGRSYSCSPRAIHRELLSRPDFADWRFIWALTDPDAAPAELTDAPRTRIVTRGSRAYYSALGSASHWVVNAMLPIQVRKRAGQRMLQCWHGTPFKRLRADVQGTNRTINGARDYRRKNRLDVPRFDAFTFQSAFGEAALSSAFELERYAPNLERLRTGLPRNAALFSYDDDTVAGIRARLGIPSGNKVVLYAPTYRDDAQSADTTYSTGTSVDYAYISEHLGPDVTVLFRAHYLISDRPDFGAAGARIIDVSHVADINDLYAVSDVLVTDYSSVFFDFAALNRPVVFFMKDLENYRDNLRGFYLGLDELPGAVTTSEKSLTQRAKLALLDPAVATGNSVSLGAGSWDAPCTTATVIDTFLRQEDERSPHSGTE